MEIGIAIAIFIIVAIILAFLFTLMAVLFRYMFNKAHQNQQQPYSLIDSTQIDYNHLQDAQYDQFLKKRDEQKKMREFLKTKKGKLMIEMNNLHDQPTQENLFDSNLPRNYNKLAPISRETGRSLWSHKTFRPQKLFSNRSKNTETEEGLDSNDSSPNMYNNKRKKKKSKQNKNNVSKQLQLISQIVAYTQQGLNIIQNNCMEIWLQSQQGELKSNGTYNYRQIKKEDRSFSYLLQAYGLQMQQFGAYKFTLIFKKSCLDIEKKYKISQLQSIQKKQPIQFAEYFSLKNRLL